MLGGESRLISNLDKQHKKGYGNGHLLRPCLTLQKIVGKGGGYGLGPLPSDVYVIENNRKHCLLNFKERQERD